MTNGMRLMCLGIPNSSPFYQRQAECGYREGAGGRGRRAVMAEAGGLLRWVAPDWAADDASWWGWPLC